MINIPVTVLTEPVSWMYPLRHHILKTACIMYHNLTRVKTGKRLTQFFSHHPYGGHPAVTRSLIDGLNKKNYPFNYNPKCASQLHQTVIVLSNMDALKQAINFKRKGIIKRLFAGPNLVILPSDNYEIITAKEIDRYIVNSQWTYQAYIEDAPILTDKCIVWPAGVDPEYWKPHVFSKTDKILVYHKKAPDKIVNECIKTISQFHRKIEYIRYGEYNHESYLRLLQESKLVVYLNESESQGIALCEAWSVNVPTFVWNCGFLKIYARKPRIISTNDAAAPYLTESTGKYFHDEIEFRELFSNFLSDQYHFHPRQWVLDNMTDEISARILLEYMEGTYEVD